MRVLRDARVSVPDWSQPMRRHRAFFLLAVGTVALAVGVNAVVFTILNALWLRPLPFVDADRLVTLPTTTFDRLDSEPLQVFEGAIAGQVSTADQFGLRPRISFDHVGRNLEVAGVTSGFFRLLGLAVRGRDFTEADNLEGGELVAIISYRFWSTAFKGRADVIGTVVPASPVSVRVVGVAPQGFEGARRGEQFDIWIPSQLVYRVLPAGLNVRSLPLIVFGRMAPGQTVMDLERRLNERSRTRLGPVVPLADVFGSPESPTVVVREGSALGVVGGLASLVLLGGCSTLAALVLVHYERRRVEFATKIALGIPRVRLIGELSRELAVVALVGAASAVLVAVLCLRGMPAFRLPAGLDLGRLDLSIDWRVLGAAMTTAVGTLAVAAWRPVARFTRTALAGELWAGTAATASTTSQRVRQALVATQTCATVVVLVSAALFIRTVTAGFGHAAGFDLDKAVFVTVQVAPGVAYSGDSEWPAMLAERRARIRDELRKIPGVEVVADGRSPISPEALASVSAPTTVRFDGGTAELRLGRLNSAGPELLSTLRVPILAGRGLSLGDETAEPMPAVISASLSDRLWAGRNPLGQVLGTGGRIGNLLVVGVSADFVYGSLLQPAAGVIVTARNIDPGIHGRWVVRTAHSDAVAGAIQSVVKKAVPDVAWVRVSTGRDIVAQDLGRQRVGAWFFGGFGLVALVIGIGGVFGLVAHLAESRRREFGVRMAIGATPGDLVRRCVVVALVPVSVGLAAGLFLAVVLARVFSSLLLGPGAVDPAVYGVVAFTIWTTAALAALVAARRLQRMTPLRALEVH